MMSATPNSGGRLATGLDKSSTGWDLCNQHSQSWGRSRHLLIAVYLVLNTLISTNIIDAKDGQTLPPYSVNSPSDPALKAFQEAKDRYGREPQSFEAAWQFGRACFDLAENAPSKGERARLAELGIEACKRAVATNDHSAEAYYYLGMNLGQLARTKGIGALKIVGQLKSAFMRARELDERLEYAGPDRNLGLLFRDAPTWTIGDRHEAQAHLVKAVALAPEYPDNPLELIEGYFKWGDRISAEAELEALEKLWPKLHEQFSGPKWETQWKEWQSRFEGFQKKIEKARKQKK